jgi:hypothetical protein
MPLELDDDDEPEAAPAPPAPPETPAEASAAGQQLYEALVSVVAEKDEATLIALVEALRSRRPWGRLSRSLRGVLAHLDAELFAE